MAAEQQPPDTQCRPCHGSGRLISRLGGEPHAVVCPWCEGSGEAEPGHDAQQAGVELRGGA